MRPLNRADRLILAPAAYRTFEIASPVATHWRRASCAEADCAKHTAGFLVRLDPADELTAARAHYLRTDTSRRSREDRDEHGHLVFTFEPGSACFEEHRVPLEREPLFIARGGDWRAAVGDPVRHTSADSWVDDFATHQERLAASAG